MATARLSDSDRSDITNAIGRTINRALYSKPFPIEKEEFKEWGRSLLPRKAYNKWMYLKEHYPKLTKEGNSWHSEFVISDKEGLYKVAVYDAGKFPCDGLLVPHDHETYSYVLEWVQWHYELGQKIASAMRYNISCITHCHSVGQVKRVMNSDALRFVPNWLADSLKNAERQSRVPRDITINKELEILVADMLALGSISPKNRIGLHAQVSDYHPEYTE